MDVSAWSLFYPAPMDALDHANLATSGVKRIQTFLSTALFDPARMDYLASQGVRVSLRIEEPNPGSEGNSYYNPHNHAGLLAQIRSVKAHVSVEAVIVGNEPEYLFDLTWQSGNWGNNPQGWFSQPGGKAQAHANAVAAMRVALQVIGVACVSPGWSHKRITPRDAPQPGRASWRELTAPSYNACAAQGVHIYQHRMASPEDENRFLWALGNEVERCHRAIWLNEFNINNGTPVGRMAACIHMVGLIRAQSWGNRVVSYCPFVSNGTGIGYDAGYILRDPACYALLAA